MLAAQFQLERSQWWEPELLAQRQLEQLRSLVSFTLRQVPRYRELVAAQLPEVARDPQALTWETFARWPVLHKADLREHSATLLAKSLPSDHGGMSWNFTSGSTGAPVRCAHTLVANFIRSTATLRNQIWHDLDFSLKYAAIRPSTRAGSTPGWGAATNCAFDTGPAVSYAITADIDGQLDWLLAEAPGYLQSTASNLRALVLRSRDTGRIPQGLDAVLSYADSLPGDLRKLIHEVWGTRLIDTYSCTETGSIALQCPVYDHYHVLSEAVIAEVLRDDGSPCAEGEIGRVVLTELCNFGMPLIRYEIGDYAEVGAPCDCGRGLPVLKRVMGRYRNMALDPDGRIFWPSFPPENWYHLAPLAQMQMVQHTPVSIEVRYVMERELGAAEEAQLAAAFGLTMRYPFEYRFSRVPSITHDPGQKFEEFICLCLPPAP
ncbi:MAG TPA: AMP-binding protein [Burkholderiales bacterium]